MSAHKGRATLARQGISCKECGTYIEAGFRLAGQMVCNDPDSDEKTECQERYYKRNKKRIKQRVFINCAECKKRIDRPHNTQVRCHSDIKGVLTKCQQIAAKRAVNKHKSVTMAIETLSLPLPRVCLKCDNMFQSTSPYNRVCPTCSVTNANLYSSP